MRAIIPLLLFLITSASARDPWISQGGWTLSQLNSRVETFLNSGAGVVPLQISGVDDRGTQRYSMLWGPATDHFERRVVAQRTQFQFSILNTSLQNDGWRLTWLNGYHFEGTDYYNGIYRKSGGAEQILRLGDSEQRFQTARVEHGGDGYWLENAYTFRSAGTAIRYSGFWNKAGLFLPSSQYHTNLTSAGIADLVTTNPAWKLHTFCGYLGAAGDTRYTVILRQPARPSFFYHIDLSAINFAHINSNYIGIGWRPAFVQSWNAAPDDIRYNALWVPNGGLDYSYIQQIDDLVLSAMQAQNIPALSLAISNNGRLMFKRAWGVADIASGEVAGTDHRFRIASCSKAITGLAVVHAIEKTGTEYNLDSLAFGTGAIFGSDYGPPIFYSANEKNITLRNLLHHSAGWADDGKLWYNSEPSWGSDNAEAIAHQLIGVSEAAAPGEVGRYSNMGYVIAARAVEKFSGQSFESYVDTEIFAPCGVTGVLRPVVGDRTPAQRKLLEVSYYTGPTYGDPATTADPSVVDPRRMDGSTAWVARPSDLLLLARRVDGERDGKHDHADIISPESLALIRTTASPLPGSWTGYGANNYGLGWYRELPDWGHNGGMPGTGADFMVGQPNYASFSWVTNTDGRISNTALRAIISGIRSDNAWPDIDLFGVFHPYYQDWVSQHFVGIEAIELGLMEALWGPDADPDGDGLSNAIECYLGLDPRVANRSPFHVSQEGDNMRITWFRKTGVQGVELAFEWGRDLARWEEPFVIGDPSIEDVTGGFQPVGYQRQELVVPMTGERRYIRFFCRVR